MELNKHKEKSYNTKGKENTSEKQQKQENTMQQTGMQFARATNWNAHTLAILPSTY